MTNLLKYILIKELLTVTGLYSIEKRLLVIIETLLT